MRDREERPSGFCYNRKGSQSKAPRAERREVTPIGGSKRRVGRGHRLVYPIWKYRVVDVRAADCRCVDASVFAQGHDGRMDDRQLRTSLVFGSFSGVARFQRGGEENDTSKYHCYTWYLHEHKIADATAVR